MKKIQVAESNFAGFEDRDSAIDVSVPDSLDIRNLNLYLWRGDKRRNKLSGYQFVTLIELLVRADENGHDINDLLKIAYCSGNKQVVYEHHLRSVRK